MRLLLIGLVCISCSGGGEPARPAVKTSAPDGGATPSRVRVSPEVLRDAGLQVGAATRGALPQVLTVTGQIAANPDRVARIATPVAGLIERVLIEEGQLVHQGDPLFVVRVPDLGRLRAASRAGQARAHAARISAERLRSLVKDRLAAQQSYLDAQAQADALALEAASLEQQLNAIGAGTTGSPSLLTLRATVSGAVVTRTAVVGQPAGTEQTLGTIANLSEVWFLARIFESDLARAHTGATADVTLNAFAGKHFAGHVEYLGAEVDPATRAVNARIRVANPDGLLRVGLFGDAHIQCPDTEEPPTVIVPESSVIDVAGKRTVFVQVGPGEFEPRAVLLGRLVYPRQAIAAGLREGEEVVVRGAFTLKSIYLRSTIEEE